MARIRVERGQNRDIKISWDTQQSSDFFKKRFKWDSDLGFIEKHFITCMLVAETQEKDLAI